MVTFCATRSLDLPGRAMGRAASGGYAGKRYKLARLIYVFVAEMVLAISIATTRTLASSYKL